MDQELYHIQGANDVTRAQRASGQPVDAAACSTERRADVSAAILKE